MHDLRNPNATMWNISTCLKALMEEEVASLPPFQLLLLLPFFCLFIFQIAEYFTPFTLLKINSYRMKRFFSLSPSFSPLSDAVSITSDSVMGNSFMFNNVVQSLEWAEKNPFAISVSPDTSLDLVIYWGGGQLVNFFSFFPPRERPAGAAQICAVMHEAAGWAHS